MPTSKKTPSRTSFSSRVITVPKDPFNVHKRLSESASEVKRLLREAEEAIDFTRAQAIEDSRSVAKKKGTVEEDYADKSAVLINAENITKAAKDKGAAIIKSAVKMIKDTEVLFQEQEMAVRDVVVDITKMFHELSQHVEKIDEKDPSFFKRLKEFQKEFQYMNTAWKGVQNSMALAEQKRRELEEKWQQKEEEWNRKQEEIDQRFNIDAYYEALDQAQMEHFGDTGSTLEEFLESIGYSDSVEIEDTEGNKRKMSIQEIKEGGMYSLIPDLRARLRDIRTMLKDHYDFPSEVIDQTTIYIKGFGAVAQLSTFRSYYQMDQEGYAELKKAFPEAYDHVKKYINLIQPKDQYKILKVKLQQVGKYLIEVQTKYDSISDTFEDALKKTPKKEGVLSDIAGTAFKAVFSRLTRYVEKIKGVMATAIYRLSNTTSEFASTTKSSKEDLKLLKKQGAHDILKLKTALAKASANRSENLRKKFA